MSMYGIGRSERRGGGYRPDEIRRLWTYDPFEGYTFPAYMSMLNMGNNKRFQDKAGQ